jgi:hypothetical protein
MKGMEGKKGKKHNTKSFNVGKRNEKKSLKTEEQ